MEYKKLLLEPLHRTEAISMTLQEILSENNLNTALEHLNKKKGIPGIDKMSMDAFSEYWHKNKNIIKQKLENGTYKPRPVMACYIAKPGKKEKRKLEIPCMTDRLILYAMQLALSPHYEPLFSESSYGFRKGRNCLDAIDSCLMHINNGMQVIVDLDIRKFFDTVNHKLLFELLEKEIKDNKLLSLIQRYVKIKVVEKGKKNDKKTMGISQGSALSPLMANIYLDVLDKYLEKQEIPFVRYADDMVIFCNTKTEAQNILTDVTSFIQNNLQLTLNSEKTNNNSMIIKYQNTDNVVEDICSIIESARNYAYQSVNIALVERNWFIGYRIAEEELKGENRADYGTEILKKLSKELKKEYGKGFELRNLYYFLQFYKTFPNILHSANAKSNILLSWTHYKTLLQVPDEKAREWYEKETAEQTWSERTLQRNISSQYYYRLLKSQVKEPVIEEMKEKNKEHYLVDKLEFVKNPLIAEFLGFSLEDSYTETELETSIINNLQKFLMELR